ncbi:MAG: hypothetical protein CMM36_01760 [Rhodospirillaceae bacterium]|nr:hypothetical protein [Rhodospirillaceae bacterium]
MGSVHDDFLKIFWLDRKQPGIRLLKKIAYGTFQVFDLSVAQIRFHIENTLKLRHKSNHWLSIVSEFDNCSGLPNGETL